MAAGTAEEAPLGLEVKCPVSREITKEVPPHYMPQASFYLLLVLSTSRAGPEIRVLGGSLDV